METIKANVNINGTQVSVELPEADVRIVRNDILGDFLLDLVETIANRYAELDLHTTLTDDELDEVKEILSSHPYEFSDQLDEYLDNNKTVLLSEIASGRFAETVGSVVQRVYDDRVQYYTFTVHVESDIEFCVKAKSEDDAWDCAREIVDSGDISDLLDTSDLEYCPPDLEDTDEYEPLYTDVIDAEDYV